MHPHQEYLAVKRQNLADESRDIRARELKWRARARTAREKQKNSNESLVTLYGLRNHRVHVVRPEARAAHLARGFLRGVSYKRIENAALSSPDMHRVFGIAWAFRGDIRGGAFRKRFKEWMRDGGLEFKKEPYVRPEETAVPTLVDAGESLQTRRFIVVSLWTIAIVFAAMSIAMVKLKCC